MSKETHSVITLKHLYYMVMESKDDFANGQSVYNEIQTLKSGLTYKKEINHVTALQIAYASYCNHYNSYLSEKDALENQDTPKFKERLDSHLFAIEAAKHEIDTQLEHFYQFLSQ